MLDLVVLKVFYNVECDGVKDQSFLLHFLYATIVMKWKSTGSLVATFSGTNNLRHPYNSIVYCGSSFPYSIQIVNDISTRSYISIYTCGYPRIKAMQYKRQV